MNSQSCIYFNMFFGHPYFSQSSIEDMFSFVVSRGDRHIHDDHIKRREQGEEQHHFLTLETNQLKLSHEGDSMIDV